MARFRWNPEKAETNFHKHGIRFKVASKVFDDPWVLTRQNRIVDGELRWQSLGLVEGTAILLVAYAYSVEENEEVIRIISARKADRTERGVYEQHRIDFSR
jgi:uncharacterized DUF497 family protein